MFLQNQENILDYAYEIDGENVNAYILQRIENQIYRVLKEHYYFEILGEKTIEKLRNRGYLSMEEVYQKYQVTEVPILEIKKEGFMKTFFRKN